MGVKDLWSVLSPSCQKKSLWELQGLSVAIDLSSWIVDSKNIGDNSVMNMYLRNLFFRTSYLLLLGVKPIFVLEGKAPALKHDTIARRQQASNPNQNPPKSKTGSRGRLNCLQKKCEELLLSMGVHCYKSEGEAEALCSRLNERGVVDAVISQDSDCFLYGAKTVLRNFTMSPSYTCDMYTIENIETKLGLGRQKLIALSLLCGCDYEAGVQGVGKQSALKFLATLPDDQVLNRLRSWRNYVTYEHSTKSSQMTWEEKQEHNIRAKALLDPSFPSEAVISEFLSSEPVNVPDFKWVKPSVPRFGVIAERMLAWEDDYIFSKFIPLVTRWHLLHGGADCGVKLEAIIKKRSVRSMPSYELRWQHIEVGEVTTIEPIHLVAQVYTDLHNSYIKSKEKPKKGNRGRKKRNQEEDKKDNIENLIENLSINEEQLKQPIKKRSKKQDTAGLQTLDKFLKKTMLTNLCENSPNPNPAIICHSTPLRRFDKTKSYHYLSDESDLDSPKRKSKNSTNKSSSLENIHKEDMHSTTHHSITFQSCTDLSVDSAAFDLSDIVHSIVKRTNYNPAINIWSNNMN